MPQGSCPGGIVIDGHSLLPRAKARQMPSHVPMSSVIIGARRAEQPKGLWVCARQRYKYDDGRLYDIETDASKLPRLRTMLR